MSRYSEEKLLATSLLTRSFGDESTRIVTRESRDLSRVSDSTSYISIRADRIHDDKWQSDKNHISSISNSSCRAVVFSHVRGGDDGSSAGSCVWHLAAFANGRKK